MLVSEDSVLVSRWVGLFGSFSYFASSNGPFVSLLGYPSYLVYLGFWSENPVFRCLALGVRLCSVAMMSYYFEGSFGWTYFQGDLGTEFYLEEDMNRNWFFQWVGVYLIWFPVGIYDAYGGVVKGFGGGVALESSDCRFHR